MEKFRLYNKVIGMYLDEIADVQDYKLLNDWYTRLSAKVVDLKSRGDEYKKVIANNSAFLKVIKKQRRSLYREKMLALGYIPDTEEKVFERSITRCFQKCAEYRLEQKVYQELMSEAKEIAHRLKDEEKKEVEEFMLNEHLPKID